MGKKLGIINVSADVNNKSWTASLQNANPFNENVVGEKCINTKVTSIPSPYARMHLFEVAFQQLSRNFDHPENVSEELRKCVAHCLDVYEILFRCKSMEELSKYDLRISQYDYKDVNDVPSTSPQYKYLDALCKFRNAYCKTYEDNNLFKQFFTLSKGNNLIAATSPFTGFYVKENSIEVKVGERLFFSKEEKDQAGNNLWKGIQEREDDFKEFMYKLINYLTNKLADRKVGEEQPYASFRKRFADIWSYLDKLPANIKNKWSNPDFAGTYPEYNFDDFGGDDYGFLLDTNNQEWKDKKIRVIPDKYDCCALKYMLSPKEKSTISLTPSDYKKDITQRENPINKRPMAWVSVDDFLEDYIGTIPGGVNKDKWFVVEYEEESRGKNGNITKSSNSDVLPPLKSRFFEFFTIKKGNNGVESEVMFSLNKKNNGNFIFTIKIPYKVNNSKKYLSLSKEYDSAHCIANTEFELGIYPFIKTSPGIGNFYRVACFAPYKMERFTLEFFRLGSNGFFTEATEIKTDGNYVKQRQDKVAGEPLQSQMMYYAFACRYRDGHGTLQNINDVSFDLIIMNFKSKVKEGEEYEEVERKQIIVPFMSDVSNPTGNNAIISIDLGTSNTYIAYSTGGDPVPFTTENNIQFMRLGAPEESRGNDRYDMMRKFVTTQRNELLPAYFNSNGAEGGYCFPIPTCLNIKGTSTESIKKHDKNPLSVIFDVAIPFTYREGTRLFNGSPLDVIKSDFKWFDTNEPLKQNMANLFSEQLCFMLRSLLLEKGQNPQSVQLYFTYPMAFDDNQQSLYVEMWNKLYEKYFDSSLLNVHKDTESRMPLFSEGGLDNKKVISADIGGGTTDTIIYDGTTEMCFSFKFAGDNLYGTGTNSNNVWYNQILVPSGNFKKKDSDNSRNNSSWIEKNEPLLDPGESDVKQLMNISFSDASKRRSVVNQLASKDGSPCALLLTMHNCAIIYMMADLCRSYRKNHPGWIPDTLFFSGNGSNLLFLNDANNLVSTPEDTLKKITTEIFKQVFGNDAGQFGNMTITIAENPKAATANGVIKGVHSGKNIGGGGLERWVSYGVKDNALYKYKKPTEESSDNNGDPQPKLKRELLDDFNGTDRKFYNSVVKAVEEFFGIYFNHVIPKFNNLNKRYTYNNTDKRREINNKYNIAYVITQLNSFDKGYREVLSNCEEDYVLDSLFFAIIKTVIDDLSKQLK